MDVEGWLAYFGTCKEYGINHVRYHSWTPPEAAFAAADQLGIYLQVELPIWGSLYTLTHADLMKQLYAPVAERTIQGVKNISDYAKPKN